MNNKFKKGLGFIEILLVLAFIAFLFYKVIDLYFKKAPTINKDTQETLSGQGIDTKNYKTILDTTQNKIKNIQTQHLNQLESTK